MKKGGSLSLSRRKKESIQDYEWRTHLPNFPFLHSHFPHYISSFILRLLLTPFLRFIAGKLQRVRRPSAHSVASLSLPFRFEVAGKLRLKGQERDGESCGRRLWAREEKEGFARHRDTSANQIGGDEGWRRKRGRDWICTSWRKPLCRTVYEFTRRHNF